MGFAVTLQIRLGTLGVSHSHLTATLIPVPFPPTGRRSSASVCYAWPTARLVVFNIADDQPQRLWEPIRRWVKRSSRFGVLISYEVQLSRPIR